jgi:hypothetical protein
MSTLLMTAGHPPERDRPQAGFNRIRDALIRRFALRVAMANVGIDQGPGRKRHLFP